MAEIERCPCGRALHYSIPEQERAVKRLIDMHGPLVRVRTPSGVWDVPRHWIALHGLSAAELPALAEEYAWPQLERRSA